MKKRLRWIIAIILVVLLAAFFFVGNFFYNYALTPRRNEQAPAVRDSEYVGTSEEAAPADYTEWYDTETEALTAQSEDGLMLSAHLARAESHRYAVVVHGYTGNARSMAGFGRAFFERGFNVLMPDCRGHGQSEGDYIGMGWPDRLDMLMWLNLLIEQDPEAEILLFGVSMGGATVMMTAGEALPPQVKLVIEDCGYSSVWEEFSVQLRDLFGLPSFPVMQAASVVTRIRAGFWLGEADAVKQVAKATVPMLFIHGEDDTFVPFAMLEPLYEAKAGVKEKLIVPGAGHGMASMIDPEGYWGAIDAFIQAHM